MSLSDTEIATTGVIAVSPAEPPSAAVLMAFEEDADSVTSSALKMTFTVGEPAAEYWQSRHQHCRAPMGGEPQGDSSVAVRFGTVTVAVALAIEMELPADEVELLLERAVGAQRVDDGQPVKLIQTVRGMGYVLEVPQEP